MIGSVRSPANRKVALLQGREGQLSAGSHVHYNGLAVILGGQGQGLAICGKLCVRIVSADTLPLIFVTALLKVIVTAVLPTR